MQHTQAQEHIEDDEMQHPAHQNRQCQQNMTDTERSLPLVSQYPTPLSDTPPTGRLAFIGRHMQRAQGHEHTEDGETQHLAHQNIHRQQTITD
ncbi:hypothetical protein J6590_009483 [Homalodisca vitripennis]|nr:hypothetical protein J6590_009483 [Homalodisca vitripennis]